MWFKKFRFVFLVLLILTFISYGQTLSMYFLIDDNALIYKLQHFDQNVGLWGKGLFGEGPYRHIVDQFILFYPISGVNPTPYFAVGILLYFLAAVVIYLFVNSLTRNKIISLGAASIFAAGYVGSETMFGIVNSWQTTRGIIMALGSFWLFWQFIKSKRFIFYILSVVLFFFSLDTVYIRAHGLVFAILFFDLLFWPVIFQFSSILNFLIRQLPFLLIHYHIYLSSTDSAKRFGFFKLLNDAIIEKKYELLTIPFQDTGNLFVPDKLTSIVDRIVEQSISLPTEFSLGSFLSGLILFFVLIYLLLKNFKKENLLARVLLFSFIWSVANFIVFWLRETEHTLWTTHRYFLYSFAGISLFLSAVFYLIAKQMKKVRWRKIFTLSVLAVILIYLWLGVNYQKSFNERRSFPAKRFFFAFKQAVPNIPKGAVLYFDLVNDNQVRGEFGSFFGGIFSEGSNLAIYSEGIDYMIDFTFTYKFNDVLRMLREEEVALDKVFTFYYGGRGLHNTTSSTRQLLKENKIVHISPSAFSSNVQQQNDKELFYTQTEISSFNGKNVGKNPVITVNLPTNTSSLIPSEFNFSMSVQPKITQLPYEIEGRQISIEPDKRRQIFDYLISQNNFRKTAQIFSASFWKDQEAKFAIDGRVDTSWRGHRGFWDEIDRGRSKEKEYLMVDFGKVLTIGQVMWVSAQRPLVPTHYRILTSLDGINWKLATEVIRNNLLAEDTVILDSFSPQTARFVKMEVLKTYGNDGPEIKEFEVIESRFAGLDRKFVEFVKSSPFAYIENLDDLNNSLTYIRRNTTIRFYWMSDADQNQDKTRYFDIPIFVDNRFHNYSVSLPATGINWTRFTLEGFNFPAEIRISGAKIIYSSIKN